MKILQVNSSARGDGVSTRLANELVARLRSAHPGAKLTVRDLHRNPHPMVEDTALQALHTPAEHRTPEQSARAALDDALLAELIAADVIVIGAPMYNFGVSAQLKAWIDAVCRAGVTFRYTEKGPIGLLHGKTVYVTTSRGGMHRDQPTDMVVPYLQLVLGFIGITDVRFVFAEGVMMGPDGEARAIADARAQMTRMLEPAAAA